MKSAGGGGPVAEADGSDGALDTLEAAGEKRAGDDRKHRAEMADHGHEAFARTATMDIAVAPAHRPELRTGIGARAIEDGLTEREPAGLVADERGKDVAFAQCHAGGGAEGFLALAEKNAASDFAAAIEGGDLLLGDTREEHPAVGPPETWLSNRRCFGTGG